MNYNKIRLNHFKLMCRNLRCLSLSTVVCFILLFQGCASRETRVDVSDAPDARSDVVMAALAQIGVPYRYGGTSPESGFDCSGLVKYAHRSVGVEVPRRAVAQHRAARTVSPSRLRPGDLVFFEIKPRQYHVGMMVDANRFVHAPRTGKTVRITPLDSSYWSERLTGSGTFLN
jgi:cell wall-associated NlpC family hydrolase